MAILHLKKITRGEIDILNLLQHLPFFLALANSKVMGACQCLLIQWTDVQLKQKQLATKYSPMCQYELYTCTCIME